MGMLKVEMAALLPAPLNLDGFAPLEPAFPSRTSAATAFGSSTWQGRCVMMATPLMETDVVASALLKRAITVRALCPPSAADAATWLWTKGSSAMMEAEKMETGVAPPAR